jgi:glucose-6-phosphate-specific signal transduction histidine kinase
MGKGMWKSEGLTQLAVGVGYALAFFALHPLSDAHWHLYAGLRLICLLLVPYRYWFALFLGEALPNAYVVYPCLAMFGPMWVAVRMVPPIILAMPIVWWCRSRLSIFPTKHSVDIKTLLVCVLLSATVWTGYSYLAVSVVHVASGTFTAVPLMAAGYFVGNYLGLLSIVPWALIARHDYKPGHLQEQLTQLLSSKLIPDALGILAPMILLLCWMSLRAGAQEKQIIEMAMFLPVAWLTLKHGWRAAVLGGTLVIACNALLHPDTPDPVLIETQLFLGVAITCLFALGARISAQLLQEEEERREALELQHVARQTLHLSERRMRQTSQQLEFIAGNLHLTHSRVLEHMRRILPNVESQGFYKQAVSAQNQVYRLAETLHPIAWRERGLPAALNETIARALDEAGIAYSCHITGRGLSQLEAAVLTATYRMACEAIVHACSRLSCTRVRLVLRGGLTGGKRWVVLRVEGIVEPDGSNPDDVSEERRRLASKLGASGFDVSEMRSHVRIFDGDLHLRPSKDRTRITALLHDSAKEARRFKSSAPLRLVVK